MFVRSWFVNNTDIKSSLLLSSSASQQEIKTNKQLQGMKTSAVDSGYMCVACVKQQMKDGGKVGASRDQLNAWLEEHGVGVKLKGGALPSD